MTSSKSQGDVHKFINSPQSKPALAFFQALRNRQRQVLIDIAHHSGKNVKKKGMIRKE
jgi:hypothetical protein